MLNSKSIYAKDILINDRLWDGEGCRWIYVTEVVHTATGGLVVTGADWSAAHKAIDNPIHTVEFDDGEMDAFIRRNDQAQAIGKAFAASARARERADAKTRSFAERYGCGGEKLKRALTDAKTRDVTRFSQRYLIATSAILDELWDVCGDDHSPSVDVLVSQREAACIDRLLALFRRSP